jgi:hypothetical protein
VTASNGSASPRTSIRTTTSNLPGSGVASTANSSTTATGRSSWPESGSSRTNRFPST